MNRRAGPFDGVIQKRFRLDLDRRGCRDFEGQPRRGDGRKVLGGAEELPRLFFAGFDDGNTSAVCSDARLPLEKRARLNGPNDAIIRETNIIADG